MRIHTRTICLVLVQDMCPYVARSHEFCLYIKPDKKFLPRLMNATAHQRHTERWALLLYCQPHAHRRRRRRVLCQARCTPARATTWRCGGTPHARHVRQHHRRRRPWVRGPQPLRLFICSPEQPPSLLRADLAADQTTKLRSLARSKYVATAPRNIDWRFFFIAGAGLSTHARAVNGTCQGPSGSSSWRPSTTSCSCAAGALHL